MLTVYKVTSIDGTGQFASAGLTPRSPYYTKYVFGRLVKPPIGSLFAYDSFENMIHGMGKCKNVALWEAETSVCKPGDTVCYVGIPKNIEKFWAGADLQGCYIYDADPGTLLCDDLRLVKRIYIKEVPR